MLLVQLLGIPAVRADGLRDFQDGWLLTFRDLDVILPRAEGTPAPVDQGKVGLWFGMGQGRLFSMPDLPLRWANGGVARHGKTMDWWLTGTWERLGKDLLVEETSSLELGLGRNPRAAVQTRSSRWSVDGEMVAANLNVVLAGWFSFGLRSGITGIWGFYLYPGNSPSWHVTRGRRRLVEFKLLGPGTGLSLRLDQRGDGTPNVVAEALGGLNENLAVGVLVDPETGTIGGIMALRVGSYRLQSSHLVHPALGVTHRFCLGFGDSAASWQ